MTTDPNADPGGPNTSAHPEHWFAVSRWGAGRHILRSRIVAEADFNDTRFFRKKKKSVCLCTKSQTELISYARYPIGILNDVLM